MPISVTHQVSSEKSTELDSPGNPLAAALGICLHVVSGVAVFLPFLRLEASAAPVGWVCLMGAGLLVGSGVGFLLQFQLLRRRGRVGAIRFSAACLAAALALSLFGVEPWRLLLASALAGLGVFGEWTAATGMTRRSLTPTQLWRGMRIYSAAWFAGGLLASIASQILPAPEAATIVLNGICILVCLTVALTVTELGADETGPSDCIIDSACSSEVGETNPQSEDGASPATSITSPVSDGTDDVCVSDECCGGGCEWRPTPVWLGLSLATIGMLTAGCLLPGLLSETSGWSSAAFMAGALFGIFVFQSVVPGTGYAVLMMSCCVLALATSGLAAIVDIQWTGILAVVPGTLLAATYRGCSGLIGESFTDARFQNGRSFVLMLGSLWAGALTAVISVFGHAGVEATVNWGPAALWFVTIVLLRNIPSPVLSQRREDAISQSEADQLLAESAEILEDTVA